jgi:hypothetical protein
MTARGILQEFSHNYQRYKDIRKVTGVIHYHNQLVDYQKSLQKGNRKRSQQVV